MTGRCCFDVLVAASCVERRLMGGCVMAIGSQYRAGAASVLRAGEALQSAVEIGDEVEIQAAVAALRRAAEARELAGGVVAGFSPSITRYEPQAAPEADEALAQVLTELNVGETLLAASSVASERGVQPAPALLPDALESLKEAALLIERSVDTVTAGFKEREPPLRGPALEVFRDHLPRTVDAIVTRTAGLGKDVVAGLVAIPASAVQPAVVGAVAAVTAIPDVGPLVGAGFRAIQRGLQALERLVPTEALGKLRQWAGEWWEQRADPALDRVVRGLLGAEGVQTAAREALTRPGYAEDRLRTGYVRLVELDERHERTIVTIRRIVRVLTKIVGPLAVVLTAVTAWLYSIGAVGYLLALGAAVWVGRDYLDSGALVQVVPGMRTILHEATA
jgi:hypothetical protein